MDLSKLPPRPEAKPSAPLSECEAARPAPSPALAAPAGICPNCAFALRAGARFCDHCGAPTGGPTGEPASLGVEAWVSIGIGVLLLFLAPTLVLFVSSRVFHTRFAPYADASGNPSDKVTMTDPDDAVRVVPYLRTTAESNPNFQSDLAITLFALALIIEGVALLISYRPMVMLFALVLTIGATLANAIYLVTSFGHGLAILSAIAVIFGGSMAFYQFGMYQRVKMAKRAPMLT